MKKSILTNISVHFNINHDFRFQNSGNSCMSIAYIGIKVIDQTWNWPIPNNITVFNNIIIFYDWLIL